MLFFINTFRQASVQDKLRLLLTTFFLVLFLYGIFGKLLFVLFFIFSVFILFNLKNINSKPMASSSSVEYDPLSWGNKIFGGVKKTVMAFLALIFAIWLVASSFYVIDASEVGVYSLFGKVRDISLEPGFHLVNPFANIIRMNAQTQEYTMSRSIGEGKVVGDDSIAALTKEGLNISMDITVLYKLDRLQAASIYKTIGLDYEEKVIRPEIRSTIRGVASQYTAKEIYADKREEANDKIFAGLKKSMDSRGIILEQILLRDVGLPADLSAAIQAKLAADQEAQKYDFILEKEKKEKQRKIIEAEGQRDSQKIINESLSQNYLYYQYINSLKDRQGTMYIPVGTTNGMPLFKDLGK
ncbi:MAG: prohibitin family protein [bacterium]